jgi:predicted  nucleic acid-binding Zn-ribbon protein
LLPWGLETRLGHGLQSIAFYGGIMIHDLESLIQLQKIDVRIHQLVQSQADYPKALADLKAGISKAKRAAGSVSEKMAGLEGEKKSEKEKVEDAKNALEKSQVRLNSIKTNREYDAVHAEIETFKSVIAGADGRTKNIDEEFEKQKQALDANTAEYEKIKTVNEAKIADLSTKISSIDSSIAQLKQERAVISGGIPKPLLRTYEHILSRRKTGKVLSFVNNDTQTCSSCFKVLETQLLNEIRRGSKMITCQNCGSIFIWGDNSDEKEETPAETPVKKEENTPA